MGFNTASVQSLCILSIPVQQSAATVCLQFLCIVSCHIQESAGRLPVDTSGDLS